MSTRVKLLVSDVDGTLLTPERTLSERTREQVRLVHEAGIRFTLASSRPPRGLEALAKALVPSAPVAAFNGALLLEPNLQTVLEQRALSAALTASVIAALEKAGLDVWLYRGREWFVARADTARVEKERGAVQFEPIVRRDFGALFDATLKIVGVSEDVERVAHAEATLRARFGPQAAIARSQAHHLDVTHPEANKGAVVQDLSRHLGIPSSDIAVIGDMPSDALMFGVAEVSIAMGNALPDVQRRARYVTTENDAEGFAKAVERFVLRSDRLGLPARTRACLFDLDGVLTRTATLHAAAWKQAFDDYLHDNAAASHQPFVPFDPIHDYARYVDARPRADGVRSFLAARGVSARDDTVTRIGAQKNAVFLELLHRAPVSTYPGSLRYVQAARGAGLKTAVVSSSKNCREVLASAGVVDWFDTRVDGVLAEREHLAGKPAPDTYLAAARALSVAPADAAVFEDALAGVAAGRAGHFGCVVGVNRLDQEAQLRESGADVVVDDLAALLDHP